MLRASLCQAFLPIASFAMNKARAMLDALMGPGRDAGKKDAKASFRDRAVCRSFLIGFCPLDKSVLGGKRSLEPCARIHSETMKEKFEADPEAESYRKDCEASAFKDLEYVIHECDGHISREKARVREEARKRKWALPTDVNARISQMKKEVQALEKSCEGMDDHQHKEKENNLKQAELLKKDIEEYTKEETRKAAEKVEPDEVCDVCGTVYANKEQQDLHLNYRVHKAYVEARERFKELKEKVRSREEELKKAKEEERQRKRKEAYGDKADDKDKGKSEDKKSGKEKGHEKDKSKDADGGGDENGEDKDKDKDDDDGTSKQVKDKDNNKDQDRDTSKEKDKDKDNDAAKDKAKGERKSRERSRDGGRKSRERRRSDDRPREKPDSKRRSRSRSRRRDRSRSPSGRKGERRKGRSPSKRGREKARSKSRGRRRSRSRSGGRRRR
ncbi:unnamed protein product [Prorocentrum cordatum]|uniref:C2H2-type domain-containing protein n=1 Tax=Prorocentrum cordatum TaxID=2364126 RepID=A0ABN9WL00_9DINO|nr:unnamed protein product [Polarella glacialis]